MSNAAILIPGNGSGIFFNRFSLETVSVDLTFYNILQFITIGTAVGWVGGFLGVGGGIIMIPLLIYWALSRPKRLP